MEPFLYLYSEDIVFDDQPYTGTEAEEFIEHLEAIKDLVASGKKSECLAVISYLINDIQLKQAIMQRLATSVIN